MKGQNLRIFAGASSKPIAKAQECNVHVGVQTESSSSKDSDGDWDEIEVTGKSWDASASCDFDTATDTGALTVADIIGMIGTSVNLKFAPASGANNRTAGAAILTGTAYITDLTITATNRQKITAQVQFTGSGSLS